MVLTVAKNFLFIFIFFYSAYFNLLGFDDGFYEDSNILYWEIEEEQ